MADPSEHSCRDADVVGRDDWQRGHSDCQWRGVEHCRGDEQAIGRGRSAAQRCGDDPLAGPGRGRRQRGVTAGARQLAGGLSSAGPFNFNGGKLSGSGNFNGSVIKATEVCPGSSPGITTCNGNYTQTSAGTLKIEIGGRVPGSQHDQLVVNGPATLDGTLRFCLPTVSW